MTARWSLPSLLGVLLPALRQVRRRSRVTALEQALRDLPARLDEPALAGLRSLLTDRSPSALLEVDGDDVGVAVYTGGGNPCLLAARRSGVVSSREQPFAEGCSPSDALAR